MYSKKAGEVCQEDEESLKMPENGRGRTVMFVNGCTVVQVKTVDGVIQFWGTVAHEVFHAVEFLFNRIDLKHDTSVSSEAWAYQVGHLTQGIYAGIEKLELRSVNGKTARKQVKTRKKR